MSDISLRKVKNGKFLTTKTKERIEKEIKSRVSPRDLEDLIRVELDVEFVSRLLIGEPPSPYLEKLRGLGFRVPDAIGRKLIDKKPEIVAVVVALLRDKEKLTWREIANAFSFTRNEDNYGNKTQSKTGYRRAKEGRELIKRLRRDKNVTIQFEGGIPRMYKGSVPLHGLVSLGLLGFEPDSLSMIYSGALARAKKPFGGRSPTTNG